MLIVMMYAPSTCCSVSCIQKQTRRYQQGETVNAETMCSSGGDDIIATTQNERGVTSGNAFAHSSSDGNGLSKEVFTAEAPWQPQSTIRIYVFLMKCPSSCTKPSALRVNVPTAGRLWTDW
ncbi:unnamed protein product [Periconia digitata]|uniref:Uncharacterized protein n=1 Tax=Periconia digitata TaxID=1303443 RepID=A0A9W4U4F0_9PLEO|nr:unnamed protein product [Periconia digitata]